MQLHTLQHVQSNDAAVDILVVNQTDKVMQNVRVEIAVSGDLKVMERPTARTIPPHGVVAIKTNIKMRSTDSGAIFGNIVYDVSGAPKQVVCLNSIHMDVVDYISPAYCDGVKFRRMWQEFEWENKVAVNTEIDDVTKYLQHICQITNMRCLTPQTALEGACNFLAANLYAKSLFGEHAVLNLSVEKQADGHVGGYIRIRSKTQGVALSLGDKITSKQRSSTAGVQAR
jgi:coatomer subunit beta